jgi:hypothetical protein
MRSIVSAPALREAANSLVKVGNRVSVGDDRWEDGVTFTPIGCQTIFGHIPICVSEDKSPYHDCPQPFVAVPYLLELGLQWSTMDLEAVDPKALLRDAMDIGTSSVLERLTTGGIADVAGATPLVLPTPAGTVATGGVIGRVMAGATAPPTLATALDVGGTHSNGQAAIGALEAKFLDSSDHIAGSGTIIMSAYTAATNNGALYRDNGKLRTVATDSLVVVGNVADVDTVYGVVGDIDVYLSEVFDVEFTDRGKNEWIGRAERRAIAVWNPCVAYKAQYTVPVPA